MSITRILLAAALLANTGFAVAASSVDLSVRGTITPRACKAAVSNGGVADFGKISAKDLRVDQPTYLPRQNMQMTVTCEAATLFAIASKDNREGSESSNDYYNFGLGLINGGEKLGYLTVGMWAPQADGVAVRAIGSRDGGTTWERESSFMDDGLITVTELKGRAPLPTRQLTTGLQVVAVIAASKNLTLTEEVPLDGSVTLTVRYL